MFACWFDSSGETRDAQIKVDAVQTAVPAPSQRLSAAVTLYFHVQQVTVSRDKHLYALPNTIETQSLVGSDASSQVKKSGAAW